MRTNWWNVFWIIFIWQCLSIVHTVSYQFCGEELARVLSTICDNRGYNMPISPEPSTGRYSIGPRSVRGRENERRKRGIVDECCRAGCSWSTLEQYCGPAETTTNYPENLPMRKRSDLSRTWKKEDRAISDSFSSSSSLKYNPNRQLVFGRHNSKINGDEGRTGEKSGFEKRLDTDSNRIFTTIVSLDNSDQPLVKFFKNRIQIPKNSNLPDVEANQAIGTASGIGQSERASMSKFIGKQRKLSIHASEIDNNNKRPLQVGTVYPYFMSRMMFSPTLDSMQTASPPLSSS